MATISQKRQEILEKISKVSVQANIKLIAVSKTFGVDDITEAFKSGQLEFGENYVQESIEKIHKLPKEIIWHFIGSIQSNKTREIAENFSWIHTIDREKIAKRLNEQRPNNLPKLQVCIQINIDNSATKGGVLANSIHDILPLASFICKLSNLELRGLMAIPNMLDNNQANI
jgi:pyridoxal phosphate enzyme (YggS family)